MNRQHLNEIWQWGGTLEQQRASQAFLRQNNRLRDYLYLHQKVQHLSSNELIPKKVAILSSFTANQLEQPLVVNSFTYGLKLQTYLAGFNQYEREIIDTSSQLYQFEPDVVILLLRIEDLIIDKASLDTQVAAILERLTGLMDMLTDRLTCSVILNNFALPDFLPNGAFDIRDSSGYTVNVTKLNERLVQYFSAKTGVYLFNFNHALALYGHHQALDKKAFYYASNPYSNGFLSFLARRYSSYIKSICGLTKKCLVLDLDNTLWGGVIGEDGLDGIQLSFTYPGNVFREIQKTALYYKNRGVLLALNSKNNLEDAREVFEKHPDVVLKWEDFASIRVNWKHKPENLQSISDELNIGLDSLVFVDDNPAEIEMVNQALPQVETIAFGSNPLDNLHLLQETPWFEKLSITSSDRTKTKQYQQQVERATLKKQSASLDDYYNSLEMEADVFINDRTAIQRIAQLTQKTNQFNLTTKRYSEADIEQFLDSDEYEIFTLRLKDRFGDNGITGLVIAQHVGKVWEIDTLLMSCRIIGRTAEQTLMHVVSQHASEAGAVALQGFYIPTPKNKPAKDLFADLDFDKTGDAWNYTLESPIPASQWIKLTVHSTSSLEKTKAHL